MGINCRIETEQGQLLREVLDPSNCLPRFLAMADVSATNCLRFIDPYGNTVFNVLQMPVLETEIEAALEHVSPERLRAQRQRLLDAAVRDGWDESVVVGLAADVSSGLSGQEVAEVRLHVRLVLDALREARNAAPHTYVRFVGD